MAVKILHISDLHFCHEDVKSQLVSFRESVRRQFPGLPDLDIHFADPDTLKALERSVREYDPDVIALTGDITTFGDSQSYAKAREWLQPLLHRTSPRRHCLAVPGNHDAFLEHFTHLRRTLRDNKLSWLLKIAVRRLGTKLLAPLDRLLQTSDQTSYKVNFSTFCKAFDQPIIENRLEVSIDDNSSIVFYPFISVSNNPFWMNSGATENPDWNAFYNTIAEDRTRKDIVRVALTHHNPIGSPTASESTFTFAYNGMPNGPAFLRQLQQVGVDLVLHGHQHQDAKYSYDFDLDHRCGHAYTLGSLCSTAKASSPTPAGFHEIDVLDVNHATVRSFDFKATQSFAMNSCIQFQFERNRPVDSPTRIARLEIKRFSNNGDNLFEEIEDMHGSLIYMSGRSLKNIREHDFDKLERLMGIRNYARSGALPKIRILLSDPELVRSLVTNENKRVDIWGTENLESLAADAQETITQLEDFYRDLGDSDKRRFELRVSHTLLPFAALSINPNMPWGTMVVRLLPVGAVGDLTPALLRLNKRRHSVLYDYYHKHLRYLMNAGRVRFGTCDGGDADLNEGITQALSTPIDNTPTSDMIKKRPRGGGKNK